jgi:hypothetical protein
VIRAGSKGNSTKRCSSARGPRPEIIELTAHNESPNLNRNKKSGNLSRTWELLRFRSKLEKCSDEVEDVRDNRPIGPASEWSTFWPRV